MTDAGDATTLSTRLWTGPHARVVLGIFTLTFLEGFEAMAVTTAMPAVARDLHALGAIALAFSTPIAVSVVARTYAGSSMDRAGPARGVRLGVVLFVVGLVVAGTAPTMPVFLLGRAIQGFAMGLVGVGLYLVVARAFPEDLRTRVFAVLSAAWVIPALVGPAIAGIVAETVGWRWVFLGVPPVALVALGLVWTALDAVSAAPDGSGRPERSASSPGALRAPAGRTALGWSVLLAAALLATSALGQIRTPAGPSLLAGAVALVVLAGPHLLPRGTWSGRRGLPSIMSARSLVAAGYSGAEAYLPLSLVEHHELSLTEAGVFLSASAVLWSVGAWLCAHVVWLAPKARRVRLGSLLVVLGILASAASVTPTAPLAVVALGWSAAGLGMGMSNPTFAILVLDVSTPAEQGTNSAAMQTNDVVVQSLVLSLGAVVFATFLASAPSLGFVLVLCLAAGAATLGCVLTGRLAVRPGS